MVSLAENLLELYLSYQLFLQALFLRALFLKLSHRCSCAPTSSQLWTLWFVVNSAGTRFLAWLSCLLSALGYGIHEFSPELFGNSIIGRLVIVGKLNLWLVIDINCLMC